ncbi:TMEM175 family protein [Pelagicoccus sp. SDUM812003]|uniref:TMEM175 family protein n=1 Tax=Pelagicoccus sp. SDUM812003 TaxID=3041267 RepID=UPI00280D9313|nr:TMEM175 family protein [Pelagicoccus sp. SDUM812003]MDQ8201913.1 TMEM175 family protein [Pelagicoccus sp. SDUM812003]
MTWSAESLSSLPCKDGFRMRGEAMTRMEVFSDAAFAFAVTSLVMWTVTIPGNYAELLEALKRVPGFALCFAQIAVFWIAHRSWSRRYGLEDRWTTGLTLFMIFTVLVYVFPLRLIFSTFLSWATQGWVPQDFEANEAFEVKGLFAIYGVGFMALTGSLMALYWRSYRSREELGLNEIELALTRTGIAIWLTQFLVGLLSTLWAATMPERIGVYAGFAYFLLPIAMAIISRHYGKKLAAARNGSVAEETSMLESGPAAAGSDR